MTQARLFKPQPETILDNETGRIVLVQQALSPESAGRVFDQLRHEVNWQQDQLRIAGRCIRSPGCRAGTAMPALCMAIPVCLLKVMAGRRRYLNSGSWWNTGVASRSTAYC